MTICKGCKAEKKLVFDGYCLECYYLQIGFESKKERKNELPTM